MSNKHDYQVDLLKDGGYVMFPNHALAYLKNPGAIAVLLYIQSKTSTYNPTSVEIGRVLGMHRTTVSKILKYLVNFKVITKEKLGFREIGLTLLPYSTWDLEGLKLLNGVESRDIGEFSVIQTDTECRSDRQVVSSKPTLSVAQTDKNKEVISNKKKSKKISIQPAPKSFSHIKERPSVKSCIEDDLCYEIPS